MKNLHKELQDLEKKLESYQSTWTLASSGVSARKRVYEITARINALKASLNKPTHVIDAVVLYLDRILTDGTINTKNDRKEVEEYLKNLKQLRKK